jgi:hypothetical protein
LTYWFNRRPGQIAVSSADEEQPYEDPRLEEHMLLVGADCPDWIRAPVELGGEQLRVAEIYGAPCPMCYRDTESEAPVRTYSFKRSDFLCAECLQGHGFVWYKLRSRDENDEGATGIRSKGEE